MVDPNYEHSRTPPEPVLYKKIKTKRRLFRVVGEIYIGRRVKLRYFKELLAQLGVKAGGRILDVGSGDGVFAFFTAHSYPEAQVVGLELNAKEVRVCQRIAAEERLSNLMFVEGLPQTLQVSDFDLIYCLDVLEHIQDDISAVKEMANRLREGGILLIHVPNRYFMQPGGRLETVPDEDAWKVNLGHVRHGYTPEELTRTLEAGGVRVERIVQTQGVPIARAHGLYAAIERFLSLRVLILPIIDLLTWADRRRKVPHGNTVWAIARKPVMIRSSAHA